MARLLTVLLAGRRLPCQPVEVGHDVHVRPRSVPGGSPGRSTCPTAKLERTARLHVEEEPAALGALGVVAAPIRATERADRYRTDRARCLGPGIGARRLGGLREF